MLEIYYWVAICFPKEIDAFLFSGPEQFFNGAPMFSPLPSTMIFSTRIRSISLHRSLAVLKNARTYSSPPLSFSFFPSFSFSPLFLLSPTLGTSLKARLRRAKKLVLVISFLQFKYPGSKSVLYTPHKTVLDSIETV